MHVIIYALSKWGSLITTKSALRNVPPACCWKKGKIPTVLCAWYEPSVWDSANALFSAATQVEGEASGRSKLMFSIANTPQRQRG